MLLFNILPEISFLLDCNLDRQLIPGLLVLLSLKDTEFSTSEVRLMEEDKADYDFYRDKNIEEVGRCLEVLETLNVKLKELLNEWPEHPALVQVCNN